MDDSRLRIPHAPDSERGIIGLTLTMELTRAVIFTRLEPEMFYIDDLRRLFVAARAMWVKDEDVVLTAIAERARVPLSVISNLTDSLPTSASVDWHLRQIKDCFDRRRIIRKASDIIEKASGNGEWGPRKAEVFDAIFDMTRGEEHGDEVLTGEKLASDAFKRIEAAHKKPMQMIGPSSGFRKLDRMTLGFEKPVTILSGKPGSGKSTLALDIGINSAISGTRTLIISLENTREQNINRAVAYLSGVPIKHIRTGYYEGEPEYERALKAALELKDLPIIFSDERPRGIEQVASLIIREKLIHGIDFAIVDYLGEISERRERGESRWEMLGRYTQTLKEVSLNPKVNIPILLVNQLRRGSPTPDDVTIEDEAGSYLIVHKAQLMLSMRRVKPEKGEAETWPRKYIVKIGKNRHGPDDIELPFLFWGETAKFEEAK